MKRSLFAIVGLCIPLCLVGCTSQGPAVDTLTSDWPTNDSGVTYGSLSDVAYEGFVDEDGLASLHPQLIAAVGDDGVTEGYVYYSDLYGDIPNDPDDIREWIESGEANRSIPLYDVDGETIIGTYSKSTFSITD